MFPDFSNCLNLQEINYSCQYQCQCHFMKTCLSLLSLGFSDVPQPGEGPSRPPLHKILITYERVLKLGTDNIQYFLYPTMEKKLLWCLPNLLTSAVFNFSQSDWLSLKLA